MGSGSISGSGTVSGSVVSTISSGIGIVTGTGTTLTADSSFFSGKILS